MIKIKHHIRRFLLLTVLTAGLASAFVVSFQSTAEEKQIVLNNIYSHVLDPDAISFDNSDITWNDLKKYVPELLPDAYTTSKTAAEVCDHLVSLSELYAIKLEESEGSLIYDSAPFFSDTPTDLAVTDRMASSSDASVEELAKLLPEKKEQIMAIRDLTLKHLTIIMLHDAALKNCPVHAKEKGYWSITDYDGPDADYVPEGYQEN